MPDFSFFNYSKLLAFLPNFLQHITVPVVDVSAGVERVIDGEGNHRNVGVQVITHVGPRPPEEYQDHHHHHS